jgi:hypothetical protein
MCNGEDRSPFLDDSGQQGDAVASGVSLLSTCYHRLESLAQRLTRIIPERLARALLGFGDGFEILGTAQGAVGTQSNQITAPFSRALSRSTYRRKIRRVIRMRSEYSAVKTRKRKISTADTVTHRFHFFPTSAWNSATRRSGTKSQFLCRQLSRVIC